MTTKARSNNPEAEVARLLAEAEGRDLENGAGSIDRAGTRRKILEAAIEMFAARGFEACSVRDLATAVGIKAPGLYAHFTSKEAILSEAMTRALTDFLTYIAAPMVATTPSERLEETVRRHVLYQVQHLSLTRANDLLLNSESMSRFLPAHEHELLVKVQRTYYELVRSRIEDAVDPSSGIDPVVATFAVINLCDRVTSWYSPGGRLGPDDLADTYVQLVRGMLQLST